MCSVDQGWAQVLQKVALEAFTEHFATAKCLFLTLVCLRYEF